MLRNSITLLGLLTLPTILVGSASALPHDGHHHGPTSKATASDAAADTRRAYLAARIANDPSDTLSLSLQAKHDLRRAKETGAHDHYETAERSFGQWLAQDPSNGSATFGMGYALLGQHRFQEALQFARRAAAHSPEQPKVWALIGDLHFALGNYVEAEFAFRALERDGLNLFTLARLAQVRQQAGDMEKARSLYVDALEAGRLLEEPASSIAWVHSMIGALDLEAGRLVQAEIQFGKALALDPTMHAAHYGIARVEIAEGHMDHALPTLEQLVVSSGLPRYRLSLAKLQGGPESEAVLDEIESAMQAEVAAGKIGHVRELAELLMYRGRNLEEALRLAQLDLEQVRHDANTFETLAWAHHKLGQPVQALASIRRALEPGPSSVRLLLRAAEISEANDMHVESARLIELACQRDVLLDAERTASPDFKLNGPHAKLVLNRLD